ncbi:MAG: DVU0772 family protein [Thermodesulfobacteriota bacterium]
MELHEIRNNRNLVEAIDWDMTPEEAIVLYLEWGNNWSHGRMIKSKDDASHYFVITSWEDPPQVLFIRRNTEGADELARIELPDTVRKRFLKSISHNKGVWGLTEEVRSWLEDALQAN